MTTLTISTGFIKRLQNGLFGGFCAALSAGGAAFLYLAPDEAWHGAAGQAYGVTAVMLLVFGAFLAVIFLRVTVDWRPKIIIGDDGLIIPGYSRQTVQWADITSADYDIASTSRSTDVLVTLKVRVLDREDKYLSRGDRTEEAADIRGANILYTVSIDGLTVDYAKILQLVFEHLPAGSPHPPVPTSLVVDRGRW